ncbi:hypothetical protein SRB5_10300 [Streptomyces sp. RB5]|uniref:Uncharacterized protein n=1 Tax=Streptomyces smaragdinus TaxID=2585196 RepID=A0A7K0CBT6_9ACTN|nr:hypothetical protein [Streptomyces smaragdinus]
MRFENTLTAAGVLRPVAAVAKNLDELKRVLEAR